MSLILLVSMYKILIVKARKNSTLAGDLCPFQTRTELVFTRQY